MEGKKLLIEKSLIPLDWNPNSYESYNEWMQMIVQENLKSSGLAIEEKPKSTGFEIPEPKFIKDILKESLEFDINGMYTAVVTAKDIIKGGIA